MVHIIENEEGYKAMYCPTTGTAFGPVFMDNEDPEEFIKWLWGDPRNFFEDELRRKFNQWQIQKQDENHGKQQRVQGAV